MLLAESNIAIYGDINYLGTLFSATLIYHLICKVVFNAVAEVKMPLDLWTIIDLISACMNIFCFQVIGAADAEMVTTQS